MSGRTYFCLFSFPARCIINYKSSQIVFSENIHCYIYKAIQVPITKSKTHEN
jgi:hypothetical protein